MKTAALIFIVLLSTAGLRSAQAHNRLRAGQRTQMYDEIHGSGEPGVLLHGAFMTITNNWTGWVASFPRRGKGKGCRHP